MLILLAGPSVLIIGAFLIIFGTSFGAKTLARAAVIADLFGASHFGRISSVNSIFLTVAATLAPVGAGLLYDATGSYDLVLWLAVGLAAASAAVMVFSRPEAARSTAHSVR
jgi:MFS family permease